MKNLAALLFVVLVLIITVKVSAEDFALTKIGALNVNGKYFTHWWYEPTKLTLEGIGSKGANVDVYVDGNVQTIKTSLTDGTWKYTHPTDLEKTDHDITVASGDKKISFILTIGAGSVPQSEASNSATLPETGTLLPLLGIFGIASLLIFYGFKKNSA